MALADSIMEKAPLLTIAIPTYNRSSVLKESLSRILTQRKELKNEDIIEIFVVNNASTDNTDNVIKKFIISGENINYIVNIENIGADRNIYKCFHLGTGKYIWVLGDDDYILANTLQRVIHLLIENGDCGLVSLEVFPWELKCLMKSEKKYTVYNNPRKGLRKIGWFITSITLNIVQRAYLSTAENVAKEAMKHGLTQTPYFMAAAIASKKGLMVHEKMFDGGKCEAGGYDVYEVFLDNYLSLVQKYLPGRWTYETAKFQIFPVIIGYIGGQLFRKIFFGKCKGNYRNIFDWKKVISYYWYCPYFYAFPFVLIWKAIQKIIK